MPHRIHLMTTTLGYTIEGTLFTIGLMWTGATRYLSVLIDKETMDQLRSADGALFGAAVIVVALWLSKIADGKRMDKRHDEMISTMKEGNAKSEKLVAESIKANAKVSHAINNLVHELSGRPCNAGRPLTPINFDPEELE